MLVVKSSGGWGGARKFAHGNNMSFFSSRPLELDTDGIWCVLPASFPENFQVMTLFLYSRVEKGNQFNTCTVAYFCKSNFLENVSRRIYESVMSRAFIEILNRWARG